MFRILTLPDRPTQFWAKNFTLATKPSWYLAFEELQHPQCCSGFCFNARLALWHMRWTKRVCPTLHSTLLIKLALSVAWLHLDEESLLNAAMNVNPFCKIIMYNLWCGCNYDMTMNTTTAGYSKEWSSPTPGSNFDLEDNNIMYFNY